MSKWVSRTTAEKKAANPAAPATAPPTKAAQPGPAAVTPPPPAPGGFEDSAISQRIHAQPLPPAAPASTATEFDHTEAKDSLDNLWNYYIEKQEVDVEEYKPKADVWVKSTFDFAQAIAQ